MRREILIAVVALAGCVSDPGDLRAPETTSEWREYEEQGARAIRAARPLQAANMDICPASGCQIMIGTRIASGYQAVAGDAGVFISTPLLRFLQNDAEIALVLAHEQAHRLLGDTRPGTVFTMEKELRADCVGSVMVYRAGYDLRLANQGVRRMGWTVPGVMQAAFGGTTHPTFSERADAIDRIATELDRRRARGQSIARGTINELCGVGL